MAPNVQAAETERGFSAYAVSADMNDPMVKAVHGLINHSVSSDARIDWIVAELRRLGGSVEEQKGVADRFDPEYLNRIVD